MGRYYCNSKQEADWLHKLTIWWLKKNNYLETGCWKAGGIKWTNGWTNKETVVMFNVSLLESEWHNYIELDYKLVDSEGKDQAVKYQINLTTTPCYFGGKRYWFICPLIVEGKYCGKRVGVLYLYGKYFGCRNCLNLTYDSRNENRRFKNFGLFYALTGYKKLHELESRIKRKSYASKPTRKQKAWDRLFFRMLPYLGQMKKTIDKI